MPRIIYFHYRMILDDSGANVKVSERAVVSRQVSEPTPYLAK